MPWNLILIGSLNHYFEATSSCEVHSFWEVSSTFKAASSWGHILWGNLIFQDYFCFCLISHSIQQIWFLNVQSFQLFSNLNMINWEQHPLLQLSKQKWKPEAFWSGENLGHLLAVSQSVNFSLCCATDCFVRSPYCHRAICDCISIIVTKTAERQWRVNHFDKTVMCG